MHEHAMKMHKGSLVMNMHYYILLVHYFEYNPTLITGTISE
jgi:hypothetical protein